MRPLFVLFTVYVVASTLALPAEAQKGAGTMTLREGSPLPKLRGGLVGDILEDGSQKTFPLVPYGDGSADSPRGKNDERLPGLLAVWILPDGWFQPLVSPTHGQTVQLVSERPTWPQRFHTRIDVGSIRALSKPSLPNENSRVAGTGYFSTIMNPQTQDFEDVAGLPFTEITLTRLRGSGDWLHFYGKRWRPAETGESILFVTWERIIGLNVVVEELPGAKTGAENPSRGKK